VWDPVAIFRENILIIVIESIIERNRDPKLRNGLSYKWFISLVHTFAPAQKRIVFYKMKVMQRSFSETRHMQRRIPVCPCPPSWLIFIFRCLPNSHSPCCKGRTRDSGIGILQSTFSWLLTVLPISWETFDRISSVAILYSATKINWFSTQLKKRSESVFSVIKCSSRYFFYMLFW